MPQAVRPYVTRGTSIKCYQDVRKHNHSRLTEQPLVTDHDSTTVKGISLSHETSYVHQAHATYFNRAWQQDPSYARVYEATS